MAGAVEQEIDPRVRRTRQLLHNALENLLEEKDFDKISVQDIADKATVNRVTFYDHYSDKFALLQCVVGTRFKELLAGRGVSFDGTCASALRTIVLAVCDYLADIAKIGCDRLRQLGPHLESAVIAVVRESILNGFRQHPSPTAVAPEMLATVISWSIYGSAQEWVKTPNRCSSEDIVDVILKLVNPAFAVSHLEKN